MNRLIVGIGIVILVFGLLSQAGIIPLGNALSSVTTGCVTYNTANPGSTSSGSPSQWNTNQAQVISTLVTFNNCQPNPAGTAPIQMNLQCQPNCLVAPNIQFPLPACTNGCNQGFVQEFLALTPSSPACSLTTTCTGWLNYTWPAVTTGAVIGENNFPAGSPFTVTWNIGVQQPGGTTFLSIAKAYALIGSGIVVQPQDFTIQSTAPASFTAGTTGTASVTITALNGFTGPVALSVTCSSTSVNTCTVSPTSVSGSGTATVTLGSNCCSGTFTYTVTGVASGGTPSHNTGAVSFTILPCAGCTGTPDFTITSGTTVIVFNVGTVASTGIQISPLAGFTGTVSLTATATSPGGTGTPAAGSQCSVSPTSVTLGAAQTVTLSVQATQAISFNCVITGTSGTLSHSLSVITGIGISPPTAGYIGIVIIIAGGLIAVYGIVRKPT